MGGRRDRGRDLEGFADIGGDGGDCAGAFLRMLEEPLDGLAIGVVDPSAATLNLGLPVSRRSIWKPPIISISSSLRID